jgi:hypothetical protein
MSDGPEWFAAKRRGFGPRLPITWQGWLLTIVFVGAAVGLGLMLDNDPLRYIAIVVPLTLAFTVISVRTTKPRAPVARENRND